MIPNHSQDIRDFMYEYFNDKDVKEIRRNIESITNLKIMNFYSVTELIDFSVRQVDFILAEQAKDTKKNPVKIKMTTTRY